MFIAKNGDLIVLARETEEELLRGLKLMNYDVIEETSENYVLHDGQYLTEDEVLQDLKLEKQAENTRLAKLAIENGFVNFKGAEFETNAQTVGDLTATMLILQGASAISDEEPTYLWLSKDDKVVSLSLADFDTLGGLIAEYKNTIWQEKYLTYKTAIETAQSLEELENIGFEY